MEAGGFSITLAFIHQVTLRHILEDLVLNIRHCANLTSHYFCHLSIYIEIQFTKNYKHNKCRKFWLSCYGHVARTESFETCKNI